MQHTFVMIKKISDNIKKFRELKNITREHMAVELGMSLSGYSKIERGEIDLTITKIYKIAEVLGVEASQILNFDATQIFNVTHNNNVNHVNGIGAKDNTFNIKGDEYREKYVVLLEQELATLKSQAQAR